jgi:hypothetical protein
MTVGPMPGCASSLRRSSSGNLFTQHGIEGARPYRKSGRSATRAPGLQTGTGSQPGSWPADEL